jgi:formate--tetrahydrofolate ligase
MTSPLELAERLGVPHERRIPYGDFAVKLDPRLLDEPRPRPGEPRLVLVSALTPTPAGEGKTTTTIGLGDALTRRGESVCLALREPSLGPCFGMKGGGTGGGRAQLTPSERINLHFTGDFHAITSAHNLLAAALDNHLQFRGAPEVDPRSVLWPRVLDMNDRSLRQVTLGLGGRTGGVPREGSFDITAASELMAILCLASDEEDLRARIDRIVVGLDPSGEPVRAEALGVTGAMMALLADARMPNLARTLEGTPAVVHGGPFANIAHGCNSVLATRTALHLADWVVTEAGFGFDLGAEKFFDIKCRLAGLAPSAVVIVATVRALKLHGGRAVTELDTEDLEALERGLANLDRHLESAAAFGQRPVVAINRFPGDTAAELDHLRAALGERGVPCAVASHFADGGEGALELADRVREAAADPAPAVRFAYDLGDPLPVKLERITRTVYGGAGVQLTGKALKDLARLERLGLDRLPVCVAKTQNSLSDDPARRGRPEGFEVTVRALELNAGAGFVVALTGDLLRMPGLPRDPQARRIDLVDGEITGLR